MYRQTDRQTGGTNVPNRLEASCVNQDRLPSCGGCWSVRLICRLVKSLQIKPGA